MKNKTENANIGQKLIHYVSSLAIFFLLLTGIAQMPIFKRYYIADIPGLGWLAQFYVTHYMHYMFAVLLLAVGTFLVVDYLLWGRKTRSLGVADLVKTTILIIVATSGILLVIRNLQANPFTPGAVITLDLVHLGTAFLFTGITLAGWLLKLKKGRARLP
jgi:hypothetical protein